MHASNTNEQTLEVAIERASADNAVKQSRIVGTLFHLLNTISVK